MAVRVIQARKFKVVRATFNGKHNASKIKALLVLYMVKHEWRKRQGIGVAELADISGVSYKYLKARLSRWHLWLYVLRYPCNKIIRGKPCRYAIAARGEHFLIDIVPRKLLDDYIAEIRLHNGWPSSE